MTPPFVFALPLGSRTEWMLGSTPPDAIVTSPRSLESSSSFRIASWMWRGMILQCQRAVSTYDNCTPRHGPILTHVRREDLSSDSFHTWSFCCHVRHCQRAPELPLRGIQGQKRGKLGHHLQDGLHTCLSLRIGQYDRQGTGGLPSSNERQTLPW